MNTASLLGSIFTSAALLLSCGGVVEPLSAEEQAVYASPSSSSPSPSSSPSSSSSPSPSPSPSPTALTPEHTSCATGTGSVADCTRCCDGKFPRGSKASDLLYCVEVCKVADQARQGR